MMTMQTIVLLGGVVALLVVLLAVRRRRAKAADRPSAREEVSSHPVDRVSPAASGPMPLYAAEPVATPASTPAVIEPAAVHSGLPPAEALPVQNWPDGAVVNEPGWLMPGELEHAWQADFATSAAPAGAPQGPYQAKAERAGNGNGNGSGARHMGHLIADAVTDFDPASGWGAEPSGPTTIELDRPEPEEDPRIPEWSPVEEAVPPTGPEIDRTPSSQDEVPTWSEPAPEAPVALEDEVPSWSEPVVEAPDAGVDMPGWDEAVVEEPVVETSLPSWSEMEFVPERELVTPVEPAPEPWAEFVMDAAEVAEAAPTVADPAEPVVAWWDLPDPAERDVATTEPATGRFALGGFALKPGHEAIAGVSFRSPLATAPAGWTVAPVDDAEPGTLVLQVDGAINCGAEELAVLTDDGFAPTVEGFTLRIAARVPGPFAASGTFRVS